MDRRQKKSREAIFKAFAELLSEKNVQNITVGQIIGRADVGRATFYAHFETKEYLLKAMCEELFCHVTDRLNGEDAHHHIFRCDEEEPVFEHIFRHLQNNDNQLLKLLSGENREVFLPYFTAGLMDVIRKQSEEYPAPDGVPLDFWQAHIAASFVQTLRWWVDHGMVQTPEQIANFLNAVLK